MAEFIEVLSEKAKKDIDELISKLERGTKAVNDINKEFNKIKVPSQASEAINKTTRSTQQLNEAQKESRRLSRALERQKERLSQASEKVNKALLKTRFETQQVNKIEKQRAIISSDLSTQYQKQQAKINLLTRTYNDLRTKQELGIKLSKSEEEELKDVTRQIDRKQRALKNVDASIGKHQRNVGNYSSAWRGVGNVLRTTIAAFGLYSGLEIGRQIFNQVKEINSLNLALKQVTDTTENFNQANSFLSDLADRAGVDINSLQRAYIKFFASAKTTNLTLAETQEIFENVSTAAAVLGQSSADTEGAIRALEQMLSKGKVQAEEIRGQLGERLPGAFQILARAMGLTTQELSKQLELGQVYADEVLPKFAKELAKTYSLNTISKVETLTAEQSRLSNAWNEFLRGLEGGQGTISKTFISLIGFIRQAVEGMQSLNETQDETKTRRYNTVLQEQKKRYAELGKEADDYARAVLKTLEGDQMRLMKEASRLQKEINSTWSNGSIAISNYEDELEEVNRSYNRNQAIIEAALNQLKGINKEQEKNIETDEENAKSKNGLNKALEGTIKWYEDLISLLIKQQNETSTTTSQWQNYQTQIEKAEAALLKLRRAFMGMEDQKVVDVGISTDEVQPFATPEFAQPELSLEEYNKQILKAQSNTEKLLKILNRIADSELFKDELRSLGDLLYIDTDVLLNSFDVINDELTSTKDKIDATATAISEILGGVGQTMLENEQIRLENQIALNRDYYDNLINQAQGNQEQQEFLRREQEAKERKLRQEQAENEKKAALFQIAISTATAIVKALPNIPLSIAVGAIGAAKAAIVASRPVPQYKTGRKGGEDEWAILGDGYKNEPIVDKNGNLKGMSPNRPTMMHLDKGDSVLPDVNRLEDDILNKTMLLNIQASANKMSQESKDNKQLERLLMAQSYNIERGIIKSLKKAKFVNNNNTSVNLGHEFKLSKYRGK